MAVIGAGLAGLRAARHLAGAGRDVIVLEARDRVGGRLMSATFGEATGIGPVTVDLGGQWLGAGHERAVALARELGTVCFPQFGEGRNLLWVGSRRRRYRGTIPRLNPLVLADIFWARRRIDRLAARIEPAEPWAAAGAAELDAQSLQDWLEANVRTAIARRLIAIAGRTVWGAEPSELSMLHVLFYVSAAGGFDRLIDTEGGAQQDRVDGGAQLLAEGLADRLGERVLLSAAVRRIVQHADGLTVVADGHEIEADRAVVAMPPSLAAGIEFEPGLPTARRELASRMRPGRLSKCMALYEKPFWREREMSGEAVTDHGPVTLTFDSSPRDGSAGVLLGFIGGPEVDEVGKLSAVDRRRAVLEQFSSLYGPEAAEPLDFIEQIWSEEPHSGGGPTSNFGPGGWTGCGRAIREPFGRVHWCGTETATVWSGYIEGALESGDRVAGEILTGSG